MHMVGHHHECVYPNVCEMFRNAGPTFARDFARSIWYHFAGADTTKQVGGRTDRNEVRPGARIVVTTQPERAPVHRDAWMPCFFHLDMLWSAARARVTDLAGDNYCFRA